ncbi:hypothetical protein Tco_0590897 [Tanacetum coccineum]
MRPFGCPLTILNTLDPLGKFDGKSDEGYLLGYSTTSKAFRVYNKQTKRVEENLHIDFLEYQPNVAGSGPDWMFDVTRFDVTRFNFLVYSSKSSPKDNDIQDSKDVSDKEGQHQMPEDEQVLHDELEKMVTQELTAKAIDDVSRQAFKEEKRRIESQKKATQATSANAGESSFVYLGGKIPIDASTLPNADLPIDPNMPDLEETSDTLPNDGIFNGAYDDDKDMGVVVHFNNMDNTIALFKKEDDLKDSFDPSSLKNPRLYHKPYKMKAGLKQCKRNCFSSNYRRFRLRCMVNQPQGFVDNDFIQTKVYKVIKALYGLYQAPRACYLGSRESLEGDMDGTEEFLLSNLFDFWLTKVSTDRLKVSIDRQSLYRYKAVRENIAIHDSNLEGSGGNHRGQSSNDISLSGNKDGLTLQSVYDLYVSLCKQVTAQAKEIKALKAQVKKLKKGVKPLLTHHKAWMKSVALKTRLARKTSLEKTGVQKGSDDVVDGFDTLDYMESGQGKGTTDQNEGKSATQIVPTTTSTHTPTIFGDDETIAQVLITMSQNKQKEKEKGVEIRNMEDESDTESDDITKAEKKFKQLANDEEVARKARLNADKILVEMLQEEERDVNF